MRTAGEIAWAIAVVGAFGVVLSVLGWLTLRASGGQIEPFSRKQLQTNPYAVALNGLARLIRPCAVIAAGAVVIALPLLLLG